MMMSAKRREAILVVDVDYEPFVLRRDFRTCIRFHLTSLRSALTVYLVVDARVIEWARVITVRLPDQLVAMTTCST
jgi:hypothetical protein